MIYGITRSIVALPALLLAGCLGLAPTENPLPSITSAAPERQHDSVVIMLPGRGDRAETFLSEGFEKAGAQWGFDTIAVDAHFGYYMKRSLLPRLHEDVVLPARAAGYKNVWLLGISMGGFGSLLYATEHPAQVDGVILLAPYLGERSSIEEIIASGGLREWSGESAAMEDYEVGVWNWLRDAMIAPDGTPVILGYGLSDGMADSYSALVDVIKPSSVYTLEGGHKWTTWGPLWEQIAADLEL